MVGHTLEVCSPSGNDHFVGSRRMIKYLGGLGIVFFWFSVNRFLKKNWWRYDLLWLHQPLIFFYKPCIKTVITTHTTYFGYYQRSNLMHHSFLKKIYYCIMFLIEKICLTSLVNNNRIRFTAVSIQIKEELSFYNIKDVEIIPNGVDISFFTPSSLRNKIRRKMGFEKDSIILIWVGRLTRQKCPERMIWTYYYMNKLKKDFQYFLFMVGDGEEKTKLKKLANNLGISDKILFFGWVNQERLRTLYSVADMYILTSEYEGLPLTLLESMAIGNCPILTNSPFTSHIMMNFRINYTINFRNPVIAAKELLDINKSEIISRGEKSILFVQTHFNWEKIGNLYENIFQTT